MNQSSTNFQAATIGKQFKQACIDLDKLLATIPNEKATAIRQHLRSGVKEYKKQGGLNIAFVGQYSAGKSTIISALTGRRDIRIDTDIATDKTTAYSWNGVRVMDTPGLFTDRDDHDEITYNAIDKSDLLVFCLTYMLFDNITVSNFKKLAYDKGYGWKMMLVVNKMSAEAGDIEEKIESYKKSLSDALAPHSLSDFPVCFIDAKDFCEGTDDEDEFLREISQFDTFTTALNTFVSERASFSKLDTPVRIVLRLIDDTEKLLVPNGTEDAMYLEILSQLSRRVEQERDRLRTKVKSIQLQVASSVLNEGSTLAQAVGEESFTELNAKSEINVRAYYEQAERSLESALEQALDSIRLEIESELNKNLTQSFIARLTSNHGSKEYTLRDTICEESIKASVKGLNGIAEKAGVSLLEHATRETLKVPGGGAALRSVDVVGGNLHKAVKAAGGFVGYKFKPWQAVGIAKNIGNAAKFLGPAAALVGVAAQLHANNQEKKREQEKMDVRRDIHHQFQKVSVDIKTQIQEQLVEFEQQVYDDIQSQIENAKQEREYSISTASSHHKALASVRHNLNTTLALITKLALPPL